MARLPKGTITAGSADRGPSIVKDRNTFPCCPRNQGLAAMFRVVKHHQLWLNFDPVLSCCIGASGHLGPSLHVARIQR